MDIRDRAGLRAAAAEALDGASYDPRKLILIHTAASAALSLVLSLVDHVLEQQIGGTGGLSGVGSRAILETAQTVLTVAQLLAAIFWQIGYVFAALAISRRQTAEPGSLLEGFRRFGPVLRLRLIQGLVYTGLGFVSIYAASAIFSVTPLADPLVEAMESGSETALLQALESCTLPLTGILMAVMLLLMVPCYYRLRMADFALMDRPQEGAMAAVRRSRQMMRGNRWRLFRVDLSFWWYYALETLVTAVAYGDLLLAELGVELPWSADVSYYVFLVLCYGGLLALYWWRGNTVKVTYAMCYQALKPEESVRTENGI